MLYEASTCPRCGAPIFDVEGHRVTSCTCGKVQASAPQTQVNPWAAADSNQLDSYQLLKEMVAEECTSDSGLLDSWGIMCYAKAIELMHIRGDVKITGRKGPKVQAEWIQELTYNIVMNNQELITTLSGYEQDVKSISILAARFKVSVPIMLRCILNTSDSLELYSALQHYSDPINWKKQEQQTL